MLTTTDSYPPAGSYEPPMPEDPRGCCWPWGPCGSRLRLETRCLLIGSSSVGGIDDGWGFVKSGMLSGVDPTISDFLDCWFRDTESGVDYVVYAEVFSVAGPEGPWYADVVAESYVPGLVRIEAEGLLTDSYCTAGNFLPVVFTSGPAPAPTHLLVQWLRWYQTSPHPAGS